MAKRTLTQATKPKAKAKKSALDLAERETRTSATSPAGPIPRSTARLSISLLEDERDALEERSADLRRDGRRDLKPSRLARVAFKMLLDASDEEILHVANNVPNLEKLRAK